METLRSGISMALRAHTGATTIYHGILRKRILYYFFFNIKIAFFFFVVNISFSNLIHFSHSSKKNEIHKFLNIRC